jgi:outer membrane protein OmpA-like peptidoglycan-associated protein
MNKITNTIVCSALAIGVSALALQPAQARDGEWGKVPAYQVYPVYKTSNPQISEPSAETVQELRYYYEYEEREPCQNYLPVPEGFVRKGCHLYVPYREPRPAPPPPATAQVVTQQQTVLTSYEIHFAFDSAGIETDANATLDQIAREINTYRPSDVTVAGYADKSGAQDYNLRLSQRRADAVSQALTSRGVTNHVIDEKAFGETHPAVDTPDGVKLRENRRVVVEFLK